MTFALIVILVAVFALDLAASASVLSSKNLLGRQKALQLGLIWLIPIAGAIIIIVFVRSLSSDPFAKEPPTPKPGDGGVYEDGIGIHPGSDHHLGP